MGKVKWSSGISADDIENANDNEIQAYDGPLPAVGVYGFKIKNMKLKKTSNDNPQVSIGLELVDRGRPEHKKFAGFYLTDFIVVVPQNGWRLKPLLSALGVTANDFINNLVKDDENNVTRIGKVTPVGQVVVVQLRASKGQNAEEYPREVGRYLPQRKEEADAGSDDGDSDNGGGGEEELPF